MISLENVIWKPFSIEEIADVVSGHDIYEYERTEGDTPYLSATSMNNGVGAFVGNKNDTLEAGCIQVNRNGSVGFSAYHPYDALYSNDCRKLRLHCNSEGVSLFVVNQIMMQRGKFGYGYKMGTGRLKRQKILLPVTESGEPDYAFMEHYMMFKKQLLLERYHAYLSELESGGGAKH